MQDVLTRANRLEREENEHTDGRREEDGPTTKSVAIHASQDGQDKRPHIKESVDQELLNLVGN